MQKDKSGFNKLEVGVIGAGVVATEAHIPILSLMDKVDIKYVADIDGKKAKSLAYPNRVKAVTIDDPTSIPECDIALLAIPVGVRAQYIDVFSSRGVPVFAEKPFALSTDQHGWFLEQLDQPFCNYMRRMFGHTNQLRQLVELGLLGPIQSISITEAYPGKSGGGREYLTNKELSGGGILMDHGVHALSQLFHIVPDSTASINKVSIVTLEDVDVDVQAEIILETKRDSINVDYHMSTIEPAPSQLMIEFEHGTASVKHSEPGAVIKLRSNKSDNGSLKIATENINAHTWKQSIYLMWEQFVSYTQSTEKYDKKAQTGYQITKLIEKMYQKGEVKENLEV